MKPELATELREHRPAAGFARTTELLGAAANRIESLETQLAEVTRERDEALTLGAQGWVVAKSKGVKLTIAVVALELVSHRVGCRECQPLARKALTKIRGEKP